MPSYSRPFTTNLCRQQIRLLDVHGGLRRQIDEPDDCSEKEVYDVTKLAKLAAFRDRLRDERNIPENRVQGRNRRGVTLVKRDGIGWHWILHHGIPKGLLNDLLELQEEVEMELISREELNFIEQVWNDEIDHLAKLDAGVA